MKRMAACASWGFLFVLTPMMALADGMFVPSIRTTRSDVFVKSARQEAVLATDGQTVQVILRTHFRRGPEDLAWIVPVPAKPFAVTQADDGMFSDLDRATAPQFRQVVGSGNHHFGCGCGGMAPMWMASQPLVQVEATGVAGVFEYAALSSPDAKAVTDWLTERGYRLAPLADRTLQRYARDGWHFLAMRVRPELTGQYQRDLAPHPISYRYKSSKLVFPLEVSRPSADDRNEILLYVIASRHYTSANWPTAVLGETVPIDSKVDTAAKYKQLFEKLTAECYGRMFMVEFANRPGDLGAWRGLKSVDPAIVGDLRTCWITRMRAIVQPDAMDGDVELIPVDENRPVGTHVLGSTEMSLLEPAGPVVLVAAIWIGMTLVRRKRWRRLVGSVLIGLACVGLSAM